jgi:hypothetical protein
MLKTKDEGEKRKGGKGGTPKLKGIRVEKWRRNGSREREKSFTWAEVLNQPIWSKKKGNSKFFNEELVTISYCDLCGV